jgi:HlyD family secretion protein
MVNEGIFREAALERLSAPERLDQGLRIVGRPTWVALLALAVLVVGGLIWSVVLRVPVTVPGQGILLSPGGLLDVTADNPGRLLSFSVAVGDKVKAGTAVARLDQPEVREDLINAEAEYRDVLEERDQILKFQGRRAPTLAASIAQRRQGYKDNIAFFEKQLGWLDDIAKGDDVLMNKQIITRKSVLETRVEIGRAEAQRAQAQDGIRNLEFEAAKAQTDDEHERLNAELKVAAAQRKIRTVREKLDRQSVVLSPYDGTVVELKINPGEIVDRSAALFSLIPDKVAEASASDPKTPVGPLFAVVYVPSNDGKKVRPGMNVRLSPSTVRREEYGFIEGRVRTVAEVPATAEGMYRTLKNRQLVQALAKDGAPYEVVVDLFADRDTASGYRWSSSRGPDLSINAGTLAGSDIETMSLPVLSLVIPPLRQILGSGS